MSTPSAALKIDHIPFGFFELELVGYFSQFGKVVRVRVPRNKKTGNHKGWAYVLFDDKTVAQVAMEAMDGYLMFEKRLKCKVLNEDAVPESLKKGPRVVAQPHKGASTRKHAKEVGKERTGEQEDKAKARRAKARASRMKKLEGLGVEYGMEESSKMDTSEVIVEEEEQESRVTPKPKGVKKGKREVTPKTPLSSKTPPLKSRLRSAKAKKV